MKAINKTSRTTTKKPRSTAASSKRGLGGAKTDAVKNAASKAVDYTKTNWQPILITGGVILALYGISRLFTKATDLIPTFGNDAGAGGGTLNPASPNNVSSGATITANQAQIIASALRQAMVVWHGTDEQKIFDNLAGKTPKDFAMISQAFGTPRYDDMGDAFWPFPMQNLTYWLNSELTSSEMAHLKSIMPGVL